jgi:antitoxin (DNA-binding transcriptional repressor) of toxin-antitoxin stability system
MVNMHEAKTHLSRLVDDLRSGKETEIVIALSGRPAVRFVPYGGPRKRILGQDAGLFEVPDDFDAPLPPEVLAGFEGS